MNRILILLSLILLIGASACKKNEFNIEIELTNSISTDCRVVYYASDPRQGFQVETGIIVTDGKGTLLGVTRFPTLVYIFSPASRFPLVLYAERGDRLLLKGDSGNLIEWCAEGNSLSEELSQWRIEARNQLLSGSPELVNSAVENFVRKNPDSDTSLILMLCYFTRADHEKEYASLWNSLSSDLRSSPLVELVGRADQLDGAKVVMPKFSMLPVRVKGGSADTLRLNPGARGALIVFWSQASNDRRSLIDSLKALSRRYPDSTRRVIADICVDPDSTSWIYGTNYDSLRHTLRGWMPLSISDKGAMELGVDRIPMVIVADSSGNILYSGSPAPEAFSKFRTLMK